MSLMQSLTTLVMYVLSSVTASVHFHSTYWLGETRHQCASSAQWRETMLEHVEYLLNHLRN